MSKGTAAAHMGQTELENMPRSIGDADRSRSIGAILVDAGALRPSDVEQIQSLATSTGLKFGDAAIRLNLTTREEVELALARQFQYPILSYGPNGDVASEVVAAYDPHAREIEDLRTIRSRLMLGWLSGASRNILAITSSAGGEGRSWFAANLATVFAQAGQRTLLIDAALRKPRQHALFNVGNEVGLAELLTGRAGRDIVHRAHPQLRLFVVPSGVSPPNPQELLSGPVFDSVLTRFAQNYDLVILDTPALSDSSDGEVLAGRAGAAVMIARRSTTKRRKFLSAIENLTRGGVKVIGCVFMEH